MRTFFGLLLLTSAAILPAQDAPLWCVGESVKKGQTIGVVGINDPDLGPHLHFEIRRNFRSAVDPLEWLRSNR